MKTFVVLTIVACAFAQTFGLRLPHRPRLDGRIIGGEDAGESEFPYQLSVQIYSTYHTCGATLLAPNVALTAAHCTDGVLAEDLSIRAASNIVGHGGIVVQVAKISQHAHYDSLTMDHDVSVMHLAEKLPLGENIKTVTIEDIYHEPADRSPGIVLGWGYLSEQGGTPAKLQKVLVNRVNSKKCDEAYREFGGITDRMICYQGAGKDSCQGDAGGPLMANGKQVGIVSWGAGCARVEYPGVYTKITDASIHYHITFNL